MPVEESVGALSDLVRAGKVRYLGVSDTPAWKIVQANVTAHFRGWASFIGLQIEYSLLERGVEREVVPAALELGIGLLPWSPLGRGVLTGKYRNGSPADSRGASAHFASFIEPYLDDGASSVVDAVLTAADGLGVSPVAVALAWVRDRPGVVAPIVGARTAAQLQASLAAEAVELPVEIRAALDDVSAPAIGYPEAMPRWDDGDIEA